MAEDIKNVSVDELRSKDLNPQMVARETKPKPTWFVKRLGDGHVFACEEKEAWDIRNNNSNWKRHDFQFIGHSDGTTYYRIVQESIASAQTLSPEIDRIRAEINRYRSTEDRLMIEEVVDMEGDPSDTKNEENKGKVRRLHEIVNRLDEKLQKLEAEHKDATEGVVRRATQAEMEVATANWAVQRVYPRSDLNIFTPTASGGERQKILRSMGQA